MSTANQIEQLKWATDLIGGWAMNIKTVNVIGPLGYEY